MYPMICPVSSWRTRHWLLQTGWRWDTLRFAEKHNLSLYIYIYINLWFLWWLQTVKNLCEHSLSYFWWCTMVETKKHGETWGLQPPKMIQKSSKMPFAGLKWWSLVVNPPIRFISQRAWALNFDTCAWLILHAKLSSNMIWHIHQNGCQTSPHHALVALCKICLGYHQFCSFKSPFLKATSSATNVW